MPSPEPLRPGVFYHIFNRGNNRENLFLQEDNYRYFLSLYSKYIEPVAATYAYCLLKNHFHMLIRVYPLDEQAQVRVKIDQQAYAHELSPSQQFSNLFNAYSKALHKTTGRTGSLFEHPFHRIPVQSNHHFNRLVAYIHQNPQKHGLVDDFRTWPYSSYGAIIGSQSTRVHRDELLRWFGGTLSFQQFHGCPYTEEGIEYLLID